jgi:hypothetical protein
VQRFLRYRLWHLLVLVTVLAIGLAGVAELRRRVAREQAALHEVQMLGASYSRSEPQGRLDAVLDWLAGGPTQPVIAISFQNQDDPYDTWGAYGPGGSGVKLHQWTPESTADLDRTLANLPGLEILSFWSTRLPPGTTPQLIPHLPRLKYLNLEETEIGDDDLIQVLERTPNLERLNVSSTNITDRSLTAIGRLPRLSALFLYNTRVTDTGLAELRQSSFDELDVGLTRVSPKAAETLAKLQVLSRLKLPGEWDEASIQQLKQKLPAGCEIQTTSTLASSPGARATVPLNGTP